MSELPMNSLSLGNFNHEGREKIIENRRRFLAALDAINWSLVTARQVHGSDLHAITSQEDAISEPVACDALVSNIKRTLLAVQTADCLPILLADPATGAFAAVHAGWRGTLAGILARTIEQMQLRYNLQIDNLHAAFGPGIGSCCFEVGPEVLAQFRNQYDYADELIAKTRVDGKANLDIKRANARQLIDRGVPIDRIYESGLCTVCRNDLFFSYRFERGTERAVGRLMGVIGKAAN
ncbi:MAG: peptidoglycan editing factor PgeF [Acidobacteria bacterium]|nr:peptidoglycan editing factor PgeF [Acidobacteriota bacterium]